MRRLLTLLSLATATLANAQGTSQCSATQSEVTLADLSGRRIDSVLVQTAAPDLGRLGQAIRRLHVRTRQEIIRRELLFAPGDTVDTLGVAESLRRLRKLPFLEYARIESRSCTTSDAASLALTVITRDSWTTRPDIKAGGSSPRLGVTERDFFGTGRTVGIGLVSQNRSFGVALTTADGFGFGTGINTRAQYQRYADGSVSELSFARRQSTSADRWLARFSLIDKRHEPISPLSDNLERTKGEFVGGMRLTAPRASSALYFLGGFESEFGSVNAASDAEIIGPRSVNRRFAGPDVGMAIVSTRFDTLTWLMPGGSIVDVPRGLEAEFVLGIGRGGVTAIDSSAPPEVDYSSNMLHYDGWLGKEWLPTDHSRVVSDLWVSGFRHSGELHSARLRAAISAEHSASNGLWRFSAASEQLRDPDPDVRALAIYDRALAFVPPRIRLAEAALTVSAERTRHLHSVGGTFELDATMFGAVSKRWDPAPGTSTSEDFSVAVAGVGLALSPRRSGRGTIRFDYGFPIGVSGDVHRSPRLSVTLLPWLETARHRDQNGTF